MSGIQRDYGVREEATSLDYTNEVRISNNERRIDYSIPSKPGWCQSYTLAIPIHGVVIRGAEPGFSFYIGRDYVKEHFEESDRGVWYRKTPIDGDVFKIQQAFWGRIVDKCRRSWYHEWRKLDQLQRGYEVETDMVNPIWIETRKENVEKERSTFYKAVEIRNSLSVDSIAAGVLMPEKYGIT